MAPDPVLVAERVAAGVALLDQQRPGWAAQVNPAALDMRCRLQAACVLCQLAGTDKLASLVDELGGPIIQPDAHQWAVAHGLEPDDPDDAAYTALTVAWQALLLARRQGGAGR
jgi:hypothetical protein